MSVCSHMITVLKLPPDIPYNALHFGMNNVMELEFEI